MRPRRLALPRSTAANASVFAGAVENLVSTAARAVRIADPGGFGKDPVPVSGFLLVKALAYVSVMRFSLLC